MLKVLLIEDDTMLAKSIEKMLDNLGCMVVQTRSEFLLSDYTENKPDLVLMDIYIKGNFNGVEAAETLSILDDVNVIYITAAEDMKTIRLAKETEPLGIIVKPINQNKLARYINKLQNQGN